MGLWALLAAVTMLFVGFTSTYLVRRSQQDWVPIPLPPLLWVNTGILLASSVSLEWARRRLRRGDYEGGRRGVVLTAVLGAAFVGGQVVAWRQLAAAGIFLATNPHSSFFYLLTGVHAVHLLGGLVALAYAMLKTLGAGNVLGAYRALGSAGVYWHYLDALWVYLFVLLFFI